MAKPAFIYAFDNLGPDRFTELCGELLGSRYKGFGLLVLGGVGPDGGVDGELDTNLGVWCSESYEPLSEEIVPPGRTVIFQFKHIVVARAGGQSHARERLLNMYKCRKSYRCELHRPLVSKKNPSHYVLVTNVEVNSNFRQAFVERCKDENPDVRHYQILGLDELEAWTTVETRLRHLYFPTIFGPPRFALQIQLSEGYAQLFPENTILWHDMSRPEFPTDPVETIDFFQITVLNVGSAPSYIASIVFKLIVDGRIHWVPVWSGASQILPEVQLLNNPDYGTPLEPGRRQIYRLSFRLLDELNKRGKEVFPDEVFVYDEIGNIYSAKIPENLRKRMVKPKG